MSNVVSINKNAPTVRKPKILTYIHCAMCMDEIPNGMSPKEYAMEEVGFTKEGIQVWCQRHNANIMHLDFEGRQLSPVEG